MDFKFTKWYGEQELHYYAEAKNLSESDWSKQDGSKVSASHYRARYIDTGIENLLTERYPEGCLLAYVVQGKSDNIVAGINRLIKKRGLEPRVGLIYKGANIPFAICYTSDHLLEGQKSSIWHLFMQF